MTTTRIKRNDIKKIDFMVLPNNGRKTISQMWNYLSAKPDYMFNATFFNMSNGETTVYSEDENKGYGYTWAKEGIGIKGNKELVWTDTKEAYNDKDIRDFIGGCPTLIKDGKKYVTSGSTKSPYIMNGSKERCWVGYSDDELIFLTGNYTITQQVANAQKYPITHAINLDGGGSVANGKTVDGKLVTIENQGRAVSSWLLVYLNTPLTNKKPVPSKPESTTPTTIKLTFNKKPYSLSGILKNNKTLITLREMSKLGFVVGYENGVATLNKPGGKITAKPDKTKGNIMVDNKMYKVEMILINSTNYIHVRQFEQCGYKVGYENGVVTLDI